MSILKRLKPAFLDHKDVTAGPYKHHFDFLRIWKRATIVTATVALVPLIIWALSGYRLTMETIESELELRTSQLISNSWRSVSLFLTEHRSVLEFIVHDHDLQTLKDPDRLAGILDNLNKRFGGLTDLGVIDSAGQQISHAGHRPRAGLDYNQISWFREVRDREAYIGDQFTDIGLTVADFAKPGDLVIVQAGRRPMAGMAYLLPGTVDDTQIGKTAKAFIEVVQNAGQAIGVL